MSRFTIYYVHGANSSDVSFNYIKQSVKNKSLATNYSSVNSFYANLDDMKIQLDTVKGKVFIIGHSLGGIYALHLAQHLGERFEGAITLSTPFNGSKHAASLSVLYPWVKFYKEISPGGKPMVESHDIWKTLNPDCWLQIVSTKGKVPYINEDNDGVVTLETMSYYDSMPKRQVETNHYDILQHPDTVKIINNRINNTIVN